ncbi:MAG: 4Fe-4S dicluster domain-containing protein, partial [Bacteroidia bacterium]
LQGVLLDNQSLIVAYNEKRGEPRGHLQNKQTAAGNGDCVDCGLCVQVCPTGIDIRKGTQLECVNCTACIDSCNEVMIKINKPTHLIGFFTQDFIQHQKPFKVSLRAYGYAAVLLVIMLVFSSLIYKRQDVQTTVLRASGTLYQANADGTISNLYQAELINKTNKEVKFSFRSKDSTDRIKFIQLPKLLPKEGSTALTFFLIKKAENIKEFKSDVAFEVIAEGKVISTAKTTFFSQP